eukprot:CAMPEP_0116066106 /NCGR_PEP_ID=MMETSP0322-20121206/10177_1 /TAXON_ID=163516 /ORGANISM="Leptocylindrus danicus var. apora, Strain B651" /LENGTH=491 /DNA_ID=CAMNT_0003552581 /DNA_START=93 /DNA_END=1564 /DNA_ORIENTATION=-
MKHNYESYEYNAYAIQKNKYKKQQHSSYSLLIRNARRRCISVLPCIFLALTLFLQFYFYMTRLRGQNQGMDVNVNGVEKLSFSHVFASGVFSSNHSSNLKDNRRRGPNTGLLGTFSLRPRIVRLVEEDDVLKSDLRDVLYIPPSKRSPRTEERHIPLSEDEYQYIYHPISSFDQNNRAADKFIDGDCVQMKGWQLTSFPSCNSVHEYSLAGLDEGNQASLINHGHWRDVWKINDVEYNNYVLKTMRYEHDYTERNYDRHRRDSVAMERLSGSPSVVDTYGFCGNSGIFQYSEGGDLNDLIWGKRSHNYTMLDALRIAKEVAEGIAAVHTFDGEYATIAHADISLGQFILIDGKFRLNDFNRCRFIRWNTKEKQPCTYHVGANPGTFRSPEEYTKPHIQTEKIDVFSMCNIFFVLLTKERPWESYKTKAAQKKIKKGHLPIIREDLRKSDNSIVKVFLIAMEKCYVTNPKDRAKASEILDFFNVALANIDNP